MRAGHLPWEEGKQILGKVLLLKIFLLINIFKIKFTMELSNFSCNLSILSCNIKCHIIIHSFIHYGDLYSACSRLLLRSAPNPSTAKKNSFEARVECVGKSPGEQSVITF